MKKILCLMILIGAVVLAKAATYTNVSYTFNTVTGNIDTNVSITAQPALYVVKDGFFLDLTAGNYCAMVTVTNPAPYTISTNVVWAGGTNRVTSTAYTNIIELARQMPYTNSIIKTNIIVYQICTNIIVGPVTNQDCFAATSNSYSTTYQLRYKPFVVTNKASAIINHP